MTIIRSNNVYTDPTGISCVILLDLVLSLHFCLSVGLSSNRVRTYTLYNLNMDVNNILITIKTICYSHIILAVGIPRIHTQYPHVRLRSYNT